MKFSKLLLSALGIFCFSLTYGQSKTNSSLENRSAFAAESYLDVSENLNSKSHSLFITANNIGFSKAVVKRFQINALRNGYVKIKDQNGIIVASFFVEQGNNDVQFLCYRGDYLLVTGDIDINENKYTN